MTGYQRALLPRNRSNGCRIAEERWVHELREWTIAAVFVLVILAIPFAFALLARWGLL